MNNISVYVMRKCVDCLKAVMYISLVGDDYMLFSLVGDDYMLFWSKGCFDC